MTYSPYQYSLARANVVGQTSRNVRDAVINASSKIFDYIEQENIDKKIDEAYKQEFSDFTKQIMNTDPNITEDKATIMARRIRKPPIKELGAEFNMKRMLSDDLKADKFIRQLQEKVKLGKKQTASQSAVEGGRQYSLERDTGKGFTEQDITEISPPARTQEEAMSTYGKMGDVPVQSAKELKEQPSIAALPTQKDVFEQAGRESLIDYREGQLDQGQQRIDIARERLDLDRQKLALSKQKLHKEVADMTFKDMSKLLDHQRNWRSLQIRNNSLVSTLNKAIDKLEKDGMLDPVTMDKLSGARYSGAADLNSLHSALSNANQTTSEIEETIDFIKESQKVLRQGKVQTGEEATKIVQKKIETTPEKDRTGEAISFLKTRVSPTLLQRGTIQEIIDQLPVNLKSSIEDKVQESIDEGYDEREIKQFLLGM